MIEDRHLESIRYRVDVHLEVLVSRQLPPCEPPFVPEPGPMSCVAWCVVSCGVMLRQVLFVKGSKTLRNAYVLSCTLQNVRAEILLL